MQIRLIKQTIIVGEFTVYFLIHASSGDDLMLTRSIFVCFIMRPRCFGGRLKLVCYLQYGIAVLDYVQMAHS